MILKVGLITLLLAVAGTLSTEENEFNAGNLDFTVKFFRNFYNASSNSIVSPISVRLALAVMYQAASPAFTGTIQKAISLPDTDRKKIAEDVRRFLTTANSEQLRIVFKSFKTDSALDAAFEKALRDEFGSGVDTVDFRDSDKVTTQVNRWVSEATNQIIQEFIDEDGVDPNTDFMLINAVALKARWASKFPKGRSKQKVFHFMNGDRQVDMMSQEMTVPYKIAEDFHAIELLYTEDSDLSMWIILPRGRASLGELVLALTADVIKGIRLGSKPINVHVELPRFSIKNDFDVKPVLEKMGHGELFSRSELQVFAGRRSEIDAVFQSAVIKVDEEGTEAAAATRVNTKWRVGPRPFHANKPFIFFIQKRSTNSILFIGQYSNHED